MHISKRISVNFVFMLWCIAASTAQSLTVPVNRKADASVFVDLTDANRNLIHATIQFQVHPGPLTLVYPEWIPGDHDATGPISNLAGLQIRAKDKIIMWKRDLVDMYAFHITVPQGVNQITVSLDFLSTGSNLGGNTASDAMTPNLAVLRWHVVMLYPKGADAAAYQVASRVKIPDEWKFDTALRELSRDGNEITFAPASLERLIDSPIITGKYFMSFRIAPQFLPEHTFSMVASKQDELYVSEADRQHLSNLVYEAAAFFGSHPFTEYKFLVTLCDPFRGYRTGIGGQEHAESSDIGGSENVFRSPAGKESIGNTLSHEYSHAWAGKFRRPIGEVTRNYQVPYHEDLLWAYEGLADYLGAMLSARSQAWSQEDYFDATANDAASMSHRSGTQWRNLRDVSIGFPMVKGARSGWNDLRRPFDDYPDGGLLWLDVDMTIRSLTDGKRSFDDFAHSFFSGPTEPKVTAFTFDDIVNELNKVAPNDWRSFLNERLESHDSSAALAGLDKGGWQLVYTDQPNALAKLAYDDQKIIDASYSLGFEAGEDGAVRNLIFDSPAAHAGMGPMSKIVSVDGQPYSNNVLHAAIRRTKDAEGVIVLKIVSFGQERAISIPFQGGEKYPHLIRNLKRKDYLSDSIRPKRSESAAGPVAAIPAK